MLISYWVRSLVCIMGVYSMSKNWKAPCPIITWVTWRLSYKRQELLTIAIAEQILFNPGFLRWVRVAHIIFLLCVAFLCFVCRRPVSSNFPLFMALRSFSNIHLVSNKVTVSLVSNKVTVSLVSNKVTVSLMSNKVTVSLMSNKVTVSLMLYDISYLMHDSISFFIEQNHSLEVRWAVCTMKNQRNRRKC
jgi:hypothetical protein